MVMRGPIERDRDPGLAVEAAPTNLDRPTWLIVAVLVTAAFALGTGAGYGMGAAPPSPSTSLAPSASANGPVATPIPTAAPDSLAWPWLEAKLPDIVDGSPRWVVDVWYVPGCPAETLLSAYQRDQLWEPIEIGAKHVMYHGGYVSEWAYARLQMLYVMTGWSNFPPAPDQMPEVVEILSGIR